MLTLIVIILVLASALFGALMAKDRDEKIYAAFMNGAGCLYELFWIGVTIAIIAALVNACS